MDFSVAWRHRGRALGIALTDIVVPMTLGFFSSLLLPASYLVDPARRIFFSFFMATVMTISAMPIAVRILNDLDMLKTDIGFLIMSALSVNEIIGWVIFAFLLHLLTPGAAFVPAQIFSVFLLIILLMVFCLTVGRRFSDYFISKIREYELPEPGSSLTFIVLSGIFCGALFQGIGLHALIGFFIAGIMAGEAKALPERTRQVISQMVYAVFIPLFFTGIGLRADFFAHFNIFLVAFISGIGLFGKFLGAWLGATFTKLSKDNRLPLAIAHTTGGSMEIVIAALAFQYGLINETVFVAIVCAGVISSIVAGPWFKYAIARRKEISIMEYFSRQAVIPELKAADRNAAIHELSSLVVEQANMPHLDTVYTALLHREHNMGTAIEEGLALPHARLGSLAKPIVAFGRSAAGIDWNSPDGKPTHFVYLILTSKEEDWQQVQILRIIAKAMSDPAHRDSILESANPAQLWQALEHAFSEHRLMRKPR
jgi:Kef-type K+ transport system membrane component KefB/mannitol/fructose-specific phosphotransferase system IIA component (Ntr-type)